MKKAQLKQLREIIKNLPNIPIIHNGKPKTTKIFATGTILIDRGFSKDSSKKPINTNSIYTQQDRVEHVNKEAFFITCDKQGIPVQKAIDLWNTKYSEAQKTLASYVEPLKEPETEEQIKQRVLEEHEAKERKLHTKNGKVRGHIRKR